MVIRSSDWPLLAACTTGVTPISAYKTRSTSTERVVMLHAEWGMIESGIRRVYTLLLKKASQQYQSDGKLGRPTCGRKQYIHNAQHTKHWPWANVTNIETFKICSRRGLANVSSTRRERRLLLYRTALQTQRLLCMCPPLCSAQQPAQLPGDKTTKLTHRARPVHRDELRSQAEPQPHQRCLSAPPGVAGFLGAGCER